tara:strand:- start:27975 stop:28412 length:438 start_codon:yes stop_codon:yes gene_type:complete
MNWKEKVDAKLNEFPEAKAFVLEWTAFVHDIDDVIDEPIRGTDTGDVLKTKNETFLRCFIYAERVFSSEFYQQNKETLAPVFLIVVNTYADSVEWEQGATRWKREHADVLRHAGYDMILTVLRLVAGYNFVREISSEARAVAHRN